MSKKDIEFLRVTSLRGPNIWTYRPVIEAWVDIGDLEDSPSNTIPGLYERLTAWLPGLIEHRCGVGERGGFLQRLREGTWPAHIMEHVAIELQTLAGMKVGFGKAREAGVRGIYKVAVRTRHEKVGRAAIQAARDLLMAAIEDRPYDVAATVAQLHEMVEDLCLGPSTACIVDAAAERRIPFIRLNDGNLVQIGYGARQRRIWTAETDRTGAIAEGIASNKDLTKELLKACGVPVPEGRVVESPEDAWEAAQDIGVPVVVKPTDANHARGVSLELESREDIMAAFPIADAEGSEVIVERFIPGTEHRLLVVGGKVVAAARGEQLWVEGDGQATVRQLIDSQLNTDPRRGEEEEYPLETIVLEREPVIRLQLERQGLTGGSVPEAGQRVLVQRSGNVAIDCTAQVHPEVAAMAGLAARVVGLDIAGIDLVAKDISRPLQEQGGAIVEVNAGPGLLMHLKPAEGEPQPVGVAIAEYLFPGAENGRIPIVGVCGSQGTSLVAQLVARLVQLTGKYVGLACAEGLYLNNRLTERGDRATWKAGQRLLKNHAVEAAVFEHGARGILAEGLPYDRCQVGVVTGLGEAGELAEFYIREPEQLYNVLRTQVDVVLSEGVAVLNADDPLVASMAELCDGSVIFYGLDANAPAIVEHRKHGGLALFVRDGQVMLASGPEETALAEAAFVPLIAAGQVGTVLAATGAALALNIPRELIVAGIGAFDPSTGH